MAAPSRQALGLAAALCCLAGGVAAQSELQLDALISRGGLGGARSLQPVDLTVSALKRYAVVIGNQDYEAAPPLRNAVNDAALVAEFLRGQGYVTHEHYNVTKLQFEEILRRTLFDVDKDTEVVFYFAGHGFQIGSKNYIVPVNARLDTADAVPFETVSLQSLVSIIGARARAQVVILDSCRDNPFGPKSVFADITNQTQTSREGFSIQTAPVNSLLAFSTSPGGVALDGRGRNSPYTANLIEIASTRTELSIGGILEETRKALYKNTHGAQVSWESSTLIKPLYFDPVKSFEVASAEGDALSENTATRSLALVAASLPKSIAPADGPAPDVALSATLEDEVSIGPALKPQIMSAEDTSVQIVTPPQIGWLAVSSRDKLQLPVGYNPMPGDDIGQVIYVANSSQQRAADMVDAMVTDTFQVKSESGIKTVAVNLEPSACDMEAGDYLDPDGVGLARYPNEIAPEAALAACRAAVQGDPENGRFHYQLGRAHLAMREFDKARLSFERARDLGHARAWHALGDLAKHDATATGGGEDMQAPAEAMALFALGVKAGDPYAFYALGKELMRYETDINRQREGFELMMRALEVGHTFAMNELGYFYLKKDSAFYDPQRGLRYLRESAARKDIYGYNNMGLVYQRGLGEQEADGKQAAEWFLKAAEGGHPNAPGNLGGLYYSGQVDGKKDVVQAVRWFDEGLERGDAYAGTNAAAVIVNDGVPGMGMADAALRAGKAAALRNAQARERARAVLAALPQKAIDTASQQMLVALGEDVSVDGAFGAGSQAALDRVAGTRGQTAPGDATERLVFLAGLYWQQTKFRVDLY